MQAVTTIGLDIAKSVFQVHGIDVAGNVIIRRQLRRRYVLAFFQKLPPCLIGIAACATSHHWSRELKALGQSLAVPRDSRSNSSCSSRASLLILWLTISSSTGLSSFSVTLPAGSTGSQCICRASRTVIQLHPNSSVHSRHIAAGEAATRRLLFHCRCENMDVRCACLNH
jgi:hypothetical protein